MFFCPYKRNSPPNTPANLVAKQDDERQVDGEEVVKELQQVEVVKGYMWFIPKKFRAGVRVCNSAGLL